MSQNFRQSPVMLAPKKRFCEPVSLGSRVPPIPWGGCVRSATEPFRCEGVEKFQRFQNRDNDPFVLVFRLFVEFP